MLENRLMILRQLHRGHSGMESMKLSQEVTSTGSKSTTAFPITVFTDFVDFSRVSHKNVRIVFRQLEALVSFAEERNP